MELGPRIFSQNYEGNPLTFHFQSVFFLKAWCHSDSWIFLCNYFFFLETLECSLLVSFPTPSITVLYLDSWLSFIVLGSLWVLSFWKFVSFYSRKYSQVISLGFCLVLVFWFCFWTSYCSDMKPPELVIWFFFLSYFLFLFLCSLSLLAFSVFLLLSIQVFVSAISFCFWKLLCSLVLFVVLNFSLCVY